VTELRRATSGRKGRARAITPILTPTLSKQTDMLLVLSGIPVLKQEYRSPLSDSSRQLTSFPLSLTVVIHSSPVTYLANLPKLSE